MLDDVKIPTMLTIRETAQRTGLAEHFIRQLVVTNKIYSLRVGSKYLVNFDILIAYLDGVQAESVQRA